MPRRTTPRRGAISPLRSTRPRCIRRAPCCFPTRWPRRTAPCASIAVWPRRGSTGLSSSSASVSRKKYGPRGGAISKSMPRRRGLGRRVNDSRGSSRSARDRRHTRSARAFAEAETLGRWGEGVKSGDEAGARRELESARTTAHSRERAASRFCTPRYERSTMPRRPHVRRSPRRTQSTAAAASPTAAACSAVADLDRAAGFFERGRSRMSLVARYYAAGARFDQHEVAAARTAQKVLLGEPIPTRASLPSVRRCWRCRFMVDGDWSAALPLLENARASLHRLDKRNLGSIESLLADTLLSLGRSGRSMGSARPRIRASQRARKRRPSTSGHEKRRRRWRREAAASPPREPYSTSRNRPRVRLPTAESPRT